MKEPLCAQICAPGPYSSDIQHSGTHLYFDVHIVTESYGSRGWGPAQANPLSLSPAEPILSFHNTEPEAAVLYTPTWASSQPLDLHVSESERKEGREALHVISRAQNEPHAVFPFI
ncbi:unnamed protein product [Pleuronectes platessa]|uniref:Uncharacterized protein n=1 Tax=Pleuronectes platessa TaxID=8262 RepID=A0A9N7VV23_PLEPL|nr:unnamed protein product [Pleuronectes platessa]